MATTGGLFDQQQPEGKRAPQVRYWESVPRSM
jgi:hypothetical protein